MLLHVREVLGSDLALETIHPVRFFMCYLKMGHDHFPFTSFTLHLLLSFHLTLYDLDSAFK